MRVVLDTSVLIGAESPGNLEGAISAASLAELHFGVLVAGSDDERARRSQRLGVVEATFDPLPVDAAVARDGVGLQLPRSPVVANRAAAQSISSSRQRQTYTRFHF